jgi:hypothetical protein
MTQSIEVMSSSVPQNWKIHVMVVFVGVRERGVRDAENATPPRRIEPITDVLARSHNHTNAQHNDKPLHMPLARLGVRGSTTLQPIERGVA